LIIKKSIFYKDSTKVYSGHAFSKFDDGKISNDVLIENGIPSGKWIAYGYQGEIVQRGSYNPVMLDYVNIEDLKEVQRINICETEEGNERFFDIFIVSNYCIKSIDKTGDKRFLNALLNVLKIQNVELELNKINKITGVNIELSMSLSVKYPCRYF